MLGFADGVVECLVNVVRDLLESVGCTLGIRVGKLACGLWAAGREQQSFNCYGSQGCR